MGDTTSEQASVAAPSTTEVVLPPLSATPIDQLDALAFGEKVLVAEPESIEQTPATPVPAEEPKVGEVPAVEPVSAETTEEPTPEPAEEPETKAEKAKILPNRISVDRNFSPVEQEAILLKRQLEEAGEEVPSLKERIEIVERRHAAAAKAEETPAPPARPPEPSEVDTLTAELAEIETKLNEAGEDATFKELAPIIAKQAAVTAKLAVANARAEDAEARANQVFESDRAKATAKASELFPDATNKASELNKRVNQRIAEMKNKAHPDHDTLFAAKSPLLITQTVAMELATEKAEANGTSVAEELAKLMPSKGKPVAKAPTTPAAVVPTTKKVQPASGSAAPAPQPPAPSDADMLKKPYDPKAYKEWEDRTWGKQGLILSR